ncbi:MAG: hypothetical protein WAK29_11485 [Terriglobales bacterium]
MAANPKLPMMSGSVQGQYHAYHAEAYILRGELEHPIKQPIQEYGRVVLEQTRRESLITQSVGETNIEGLISFKRGHTRVAGTQAKHKTDLFGHDHAGFVTLSTGAIEGYNVEDIITADGVVAQISTEHPMTNGDVPRVNFIGTRFDNLRVGGYPVEVELDLGICGPKPDNDRHYLLDRNFLDSVHRQLDSFVEAEDLPESMAKDYDAKIAYIDDLKKRAKEESARVVPDDRNGYPKLRFSLVKKIKPIPLPGVRTFGNHIFIPNFGTVALAEVEVGMSAGHANFPHREGDRPPASPSASNYFTLDMLKMRLGCPVQGNTSAASAKANGQNGPLSK